MDDNFDLKSLKDRTSKKKKVNSRTKGNRFENKVAGMLNDRFKTTDFCRSPGSGAFATTHKLPEHLQIYGDLITPQNFKFIIECKKGYNKESLYSFWKPNSELQKFFKQSEKDSKKAGKPSIIIFQQDRSLPLCLVKADIFPEIEEMISFKNYRVYLLKDLLSLEDYYFLENV